MEAELKIETKINGKHPLDLWGCLLSGEFIKNSKKVVKYFGYNDRIVSSLVIMYFYPQDGKHIYKILNLSFETKFTLLRHPLKNN